jgi:hypothetical protein
MLFCTSEVVCLTALQATVSASKQGMAALTGHASVAHAESRVVAEPGMRHAAEGKDEAASKRGAGRTIEA